MGRLFLFMLLFCGLTANAKTKYEKPPVAKIKTMLTTLQYKVTQQDGTEPAFKNKYWDNKKLGIYVDIVSGEPLFSSADKFKSGTGWPSFTKPIKGISLVEKEDRKLWSKRTEVRSKFGDSHLGHVFNDGPKPTGLRYCINSASLRFVPAGELVKQGYGEYLHLFEEQKPMIKKAYFAGGCFWCVEKDFEKIASGINAVTSGYIGGRKADAAYKKVSSGTTEHIEAVEVRYDSSIISYNDLLDYFWLHHDATDGGGQFGDRGEQYRPVIFYSDASEKKAAEQSKIKLTKANVFENKILTEIIEASTFYPAEGYHQDYYKKDPIRYKTYRFFSGRDKVIKKHTKLYEKKFGKIKVKRKK